MFSRSEIGTSNNLYNSRDFHMFTNPMKSHGPTTVEIFYIFKYKLEAERFDSTAVEILI